jgi:hypothetical protein
MNNMNDSYKILSVDNIQSMSMSDIVSAYRSGYKLDDFDSGTKRLDISTWLSETTCIGSSCIGNQYVAAIGGLTLLILLTR